MDKLGILNGFNIYSSNIMNNSYYDKKWKEIRKIEDFWNYVHNKYEHNDTSLSIQKSDGDGGFYNTTEYKRTAGLRLKTKWDKDCERLRTEEDKQGIWKYLNNKSIDPLEKEWLINFMDKEGFGKFMPWVMINISPKWIFPHLINWKLQSMFFKQIIENRFKKWEKYVDKCEYVLEPGKSGDHLHAHIMMRCNKTFNEKSFRTWINKGNLTQQFRAEFYKCKKFQGAVGQRPAFQTKLVLNEEIYRDTLNYLSEELKSEDHQNDFTIMPFCPLRVSL